MPIWCVFLIAKAEKLAISLHIEEYGNRAEVTACAVGARTRENSKRCLAAGKWKLVRTGQLQRTALLLH